MEHGFGYARLGWLLLYAGLPTPSRELTNGGLSEGLGFFGPKLKGTARGWFHRAARTFGSWQWRDNRLPAPSAHYKPGVPSI